ncbi:hypothetical protein D3C72_2082060 [compost metagenome]
MGVRYPIMPRLKMLGLNQPMSSPMIIRMFGLAPAAVAGADCCALAGVAPPDVVSAAAAIALPASRRLRRLTLKGCSLCW